MHWFVHLATGVCSDVIHQSPLSVESVVQSHVCVLQGTEVIVRHTQPTDGVSRVEQNITGREKGTMPPTSLLGELDWSMQTQTQYAPPEKSGPGHCSNDMIFTLFDVHNFVRCFQN